MQRLPADVLRHILVTKLDSARDRFVFALVCRAWRDAAAGADEVDLASPTRRGAVWQIRSFARVENSMVRKVTDDVVVRVVSRTAGRMQRLCLAGCMRVTDRALERLAAEDGLLGALRAVDLSGCWNVTLDGLRMLLDAAPQLAWLSLSGLRFTVRDDVLDLLARHGSLCQINLTRCVFISDAAVSRLYAALPGVELVLTGCDRLVKHEQPLGRDCIEMHA